MKPTYFDLTVRDLGQARQFFAQVLGWEFQRFPMPYEYYRIRAGGAKEQGIDGGIGALADAAAAGGVPTTQVTVPVPDVDEIIKKVRANGGSIIEEKMPIPGVGWYATCAEPGGLKFGIIEADSSAG
ncbi:MAG TPA: VOC family protein [Sphingomicrobium sp.]|nr:VOC family protein [Sphingomicrobium sp.]